MYIHPTIPDILLDSLLCNWNLRATRNELYQLRVCILATQWSLWVGNRLYKRKMGALLTSSTCGAIG